MRPLLALLGALSTAYGFEIFVSPEGNNGFLGTEDRPLASLWAARDRVRASGRIGKEAVTVWLEDGTYFLEETLVFTPQDSGTNDFPIVYRARHPGKAVLSGGIPLDLKWEEGPQGIWQAATPEGLKLDQLFVNGECEWMARYPNYNPDLRTTAYHGAAADAIAPSRVAKWADPTGAYVHAMHAGHWGGYHYLVESKNPDGTLKLRGGWQNNRPGNMHPQDRMIENVREELDAPHEWFQDSQAKILYFMPPIGMELPKAECIGVNLTSLVELQGTSANPVHDLQFSGLVFRHAARTFMQNKEPLLRSDWTLYRGAAFFITGAEDCVIEQCEFDRLGGNVLMASNYNRRLLFKGLHIHDAGASGVVFVGDPAGVRNGLFRYEQAQDFAKLDLTPGPLGENFPLQCRVENCLIHGIGRTEKQGAGVQVSMAQGITLSHLSIYDTSRAGINFNEGTWGGHVIEWCDVFDTVLETGDHGSFNSWGRDRYWNAHRDTSQKAVQANKNLPYLDVVQPIEIRYSRWRCDHGWDVDLDDGSSNYRIHHNLFLHGGLKFREGFGRWAWNNILVNCGFHPHAWFLESGDRFTQNIVTARYAPYGMPAVWGDKIDENLFATEAIKTASCGPGRDTHSLVGDPEFLNPAQGDFRVKADSPALKLGFENFPMDQFGVTDPVLKRLAQSPKIDPWPAPR